MGVLDAGLGLGIEVGLGWWSLGVAEEEEERIWMGAGGRQGIKCCIIHICRFRRSLGASSLFSR